MKRSKLLLAPLQKRILYLTTATLWFSGAIWLYLLEADPSRPLWMKLHGAAAMIFLIVFGTLLVQHIPAGWLQADQRPSGGWLVLTCVLLIVSGWGLYYVGNEVIRSLTSRFHTVLGLLLPVLLFLHIRLANRKV